MARKQTNPFDSLQEATPTDYAFALGNHSKIILNNGHNIIKILGSVTIAVVLNKVYGLNMKGAKLTLTRRKFEFDLAKPYVKLKIGDIIKNEDGFRFELVKIRGDGKRIAKNNYHKEISSEDESETDDELPYVYRCPKNKVSPNKTKMVNTFTQTNDVESSDDEVIEVLPTKEEQREDERRKEDRNENRIRIAREYTIERLRIQRERKEEKKRQEEEIKREEMNLYWRTVENRLGGKLSLPQRMRYTQFVENMLNDERISLETRKTEVRRMIHKLNQMEDIINGESDDELDENASNLQKRILKNLQDKIERENKDIPDEILTLESDMKRNQQARRYVEIDYMEMCDSSNGQPEINSAEYSEDFMSTPRPIIRPGRRYTAFESPLIHSYSPSNSSQTSENYPENLPGDLHLNPVYTPSYLQRAQNSPTDSVIYSPISPSDSPASITHTMHNSSPNSSQSISPPYEPLNQQFLTNSSTSNTAYSPKTPTHDVYDPQSARQPFSPVYVPIYSQILTNIPTNRSQGQVYSPVSPTYSQQSTQNFSPVYAPEISQIFTNLPANWARKTSYSPASSAYSNHNAQQLSPVYAPEISQILANLPITRTWYSPTSPTYSYHSPERSSPNFSPVYAPQIINSPTNRPLSQRYSPRSPIYSGYSPQTSPQYYSSQIIQPTTSSSQGSQNFTNFSPYSPKSPQMSSDNESGNDTKI